MNRYKSFTFFVLFLVCFCLTLTAKFNFFVVNRDESNRVYLILSLLLICSGVLLGFCIRELNPKRAFGRSLLDGVAINLVVFLGVNLTETALSRQYYRRHNQIQNFSTLNGHCGIHAGRTILKLIHAQDDSTPRGALEEFSMMDHCRLSHLSYLMSHKTTFCESGEDPIDCQIRWMGGIAEHGFWNHTTRMFFYDQVMKVWPDSKKEEALVNYFLKDQEFELGRQSILRQAGIEEALNAEALLLQAKEEFDNLVLSREIVKSIEPLVSVVTTVPPPYLFKFMDTQAELTNKLAKISELEKEIQRLEGQTH